MVASRETGAGKPESDCRLQRAMDVHTEPDHLGSVGDEMVIIRLHLGGGKDDAERIPRDPGTGSLGPALWTWK